MISLNKIMIKFPFHPTVNRQAGISLMLAVLVLAAITAVAFSLATIVFIEIRSAGDSSRTEPALYATLGVTEEALFQYKRLSDPSDGGGLDVPACLPKELKVCSLNGVSLSMPGTQPIAFDESPRVEYVPRGVTKTIPMYLADVYTQQYTTLKLDLLPNETNQAIKTSFIITKDYQTEPEYEVFCNGSVEVGTQCVYTDFQTDGQYDLILENPSADQDLAVSISTVRVGKVTPSGLPFVGEQVLRIMANYAGLTRTYQVRIPIP